MTTLALMFPLKGNLVDGVFIQSPET